MTSSTLPSFSSPPVVEVVIGVQFDALPIYSNALAGWFWKGYLGSEWKTSNEAPRIEDVFERFDAGGRWAVSPKPGILVRNSPVPERLQIMQPDSGRLLQIQDTRFILNWRKDIASPLYPSYSTLVSEFFALLKEFERFAADTRNPPLKFNQWEVTYVNHIPKGALWSSVSDWPQVLPFIEYPKLHLPSSEPESFRGNWVHVLPENKGRLHTALQLARVDGGAAGGIEILSLQFTSRGPVPTYESLRDSLELGHESIVRSFAALTSRQAHQAWGRTA